MGEKILNLIAVIEKDAPQLKEVWNAAVDVFGPTLGGLHLAEPVDPTCCDKLVAACEAKLAADGPVGAGGIFPGDGSVLKALLQFLMILAPLILKPAPTA